MALHQHGQLRVRLNGRLTAVFRITPSLFAAVNSSWQSVLLYYGVATAALAALWTVLGGDSRTSVPAEALAAVEEIVPNESALMEVMKMRNILLIAARVFGGMWVFQLYTAFLSHFRFARGMSLEQASLMTQVLPLSGLFAAVGGGIGTARSGLRKPFTWPIAFFTLFGCIGAIELTDPTGIRLSLVLVGIGSAGSLAAVFTLMMELPNMTPTRLGAAQGFVWAVGYFGAFMSPVLGGLLAQSMGLRPVMLGFLAFPLLPIIAMYFLPETGSGRRAVEMATAPSTAAVGSQANP